MDDEIGVAYSPEILPPYVPERTRRQNRRRNIAVFTLILFCVLYGAAFALLGEVLFMAFLVPVVILALLVIWALPDTKSAPIVLLENLFFIFLGARVMWPNYLALTITGLPWFTAERLTGVPMAAIFLVCFSTSPTFRDELSDRLGAIKPTSWGLLAFVLVQILTTFLSVNKGVSISKFLTSQIDWTCMFLIAVHTFGKPGMVLRFGHMMWGMALVVCGIALWEYHLGQLPWVGHIPSFLQIDDDSVMRALAGAHRLSGVYRVQSSFSTPLGLGEFIALAVPFVYHFAVHEFSRTTRIAALASIPILLTVAVLSHARSGVIGCLMAALLYLFYWSVQQWRSRKTLFYTAVIYSYPIVGALAVASTFVIGRVRANVWGSGAEQFSNDARRIQWNMGIPKILANPIGHGIGTRAEVLQFYDPGGLLTVDSYYLGLLLEYGFLGFAIYMGMYAYAAMTGARLLYDGPKRDLETSILAPAVIAVINFLVIKSVFAQEDNHTIAFMLMGMLVALAYRLRIQATAPAPKPQVEPAEPLRRSTRASIPAVAHIRPTGNRRP